MLSIVAGGLALAQPAGARDRAFFGTDVPSADTSLIDRRGSSSSSSHMTAAQAAREAQRQYGGGKVLNVDSTGDGFRVKLLLDGDVRMVLIPDR